MKRQMYHTQEHRAQVLTEPVEYERDDAWLGKGAYFWDDINDAKAWGRSSKKTTGQYEIYKSDIDCKDVLNTVFNEKHYRFWINQIEKVGNDFLIKTGSKLTLKELNEYFDKDEIWNEVTGILFQDLPNNIKQGVVQPIRYTKRTRYFVYKKRIQLVVYAQNIILNFVLFKTINC